MVLGAGHVEQLIKLIMSFFQVLVNDFFLVACLDDFIENARLFIFETFCRIHQCISIRYNLKKTSHNISG